MASTSRRRPRARHRSATAATGFTLASAGLAVDHGDSGQPGIGSEEGIDGGGIDGSDSAKSQGVTCRPWARAS